MNGSDEARGTEQVRGPGEVRRVEGVAPADAALGWRCAACGEPLVLSTVMFEYMRGTFEVELPACPRCGLVLVSEELANGKMANAERVLEDK